MTAKKYGMTGLDGVAKKKADLYRKLAAEASRVVKSSRNSAAKQVTKELKSRKLTRGGITFQQVKKYLFKNPVTDLVTVNQLFTGFNKDVKITDYRLPIWQMRVKMKDVRWTDRLGNPYTRKVVSVIMGSQTYEYPGVFLVVQKKWQSKVPTGKFYGLYREGAKRYPLGKAEGIGIASMLRASGVDSVITNNVQGGFERGLRERLGGVLRRLGG